MSRLGLSVGTARSLLGRTARRLAEQRATRTGTSAGGHRRSDLAARGVALAEGTLADLAAGSVPDELDTIVAAIAVFARQADAALDRSGPAAAAVPLAKAAQVTFHRALHFDGLTSPLVDATSELLQPLHDSIAWQRATEPGPYVRARHTAPPRAEKHTPRPHRLLLVTLKNWKFLDPVAQAYENRDDVEIRRIDLADLPGLPLSGLQQLRLRLTRPVEPQGVRDLAWAAPLVEALDWADTVFLDWLQRGAVLLSLLDPLHTRVVVRLHSFEAFTLFPHLVDYGGIDDLVVVGPHLGRLLDRLVPVATGPRRHVLANLADLRAFAGPKADDARFTLAVVGYGVVAKDPIWAVEVLARLRAHDSRYRLLLVGADFDDQTSAGSAAYRNRLLLRSSAPDVAGAITRIPFASDVPAVLRRVGVIVSSSARESFHLALVEGAASGAVPVVRDWPLFAGVGGPADLFPAEWVTPTPQQAAARILALTADAPTWRAEGQRAADWVLERYDIAVTRPHFDDLLLGSHDR